MMIEHVLKPFLGKFDKIICVIRDEFKTVYKDQLNELVHKYNVIYVSVPRITMGAAITCLAAHLKIDKDSEVFFADSDNIFYNNDIDNFLKYLDIKKPDACLLTYQSDNPNFSYVQIDENKFVIKTKEKECISQHAICGVYYFKNIELFINSVIDLIIDADLERGEFYMSSVYNHALNFTKNISIFQIKNFSCVGTPDQLKEYINERHN